MRLSDDMAISGEELAAAHPKPLKAEVVSTVEALTERILGA